MHHVARREFTLRFGAIDLRKGIGIHVTERMQTIPAAHTVHRPIRAAIGVVCKRARAVYLREVERLSLLPKTVFKSIGTEVFRANEVLRIGEIDLLRAEAVGTALNLVIANALGHPFSAGNEFQEKSFLRIGHGHADRARRAVDGGNGVAVFLDQFADHFNGLTRRAAAFQEQKRDVVGFQNVFFGLAVAEFIYAHHTDRHLILVHAVRPGDGARAGLIRARRIGVGIRFRRLRDMMALHGKEIFVRCMDDVRLKVCVAGAAGPVVVCSGEHCAAHCRISAGNKTKAHNQFSFSAVSGL